MDNNKEVKSTMVRYNHRVYESDGKTLRTEVMQEFSCMDNAKQALNELVTIDKKNEDPRSLWNYCYDGTTVSWSFQCRDYCREVTYWEIELEGGNK